MSAVGAGGYRRLISSISPDALRLFGRPYILQHCLNALRQERITLSYQAYMTDALAHLMARKSGGTTWWPGLWKTAHSRRSRPLMK